MVATTSTLKETQLTRQVQDWLREADAPVPPLGAKAKHIRDPLHGSVVLSPHEVRLLDTLPMQRLRGIHQLGLAYLTFPSAAHSRFEHALGVRFVAERMLDRLEDVRGKPFTVTQRATVLAAALLHDVGHGVFSHAIEEIIGEFPALRAQYDPEQGSLHEQIGAALIQTAPLATCLGEMDVDPAAVAALITHDLARLATSDVPPELWGVISGPLDADKLDYFARDSYFSGVVSAVDPDRILRMLTIGSTSELAIMLSGASALDQMLNERVRVYSDLYGHQKILAAESMVRALVEAMLNSGSGGRRRHLTIRRADGHPMSLKLDRVTDFLRMSDEVFLAAPTDSDTVASIQNRLLRRELLRSAYTLTFEAVRGAGDAAYLRGLRRLRTPASLTRLRHAIHDRHPEIALADIWVATVRQPSMESMSNIIIGRDGQVVRMGTMFADWDSFDDQGVPAHTIRRHFELYHARLQIFCPPQDAERITPTARAVLQDAWGDETGELV